MSKGRSMSLQRVLDYAPLLRVLPFAESPTRSAWRGSFRSMTHCTSTLVTSGRSSSNPDFSIVKVEHQEVRHMLRFIQEGMLILFTIASLTFFSSSTFAQDVPSDYQEVLKFLGRTGDFKANVLKVNVPRNDLHVSIAGNSAPTPFGFGGWVAMTKGEGGEEVLMGDLVLLQEEVNPVMSSLLEHGLDVTALHNHFFWDEPRLFFMHIHGHGKAARLAEQAKPALDLIGHAGPLPPGSATAKALPSQPPLDTAKLAKIAGHEGEQSGAVYKITVGRDDLSVKEMGATINVRMGLNTWAAFTGSEDHAIVAGDVAMLDREVTPVLKALRSHGLDVVAIHHHMTTAQPTIIFLHYWGEGPAEQLAGGFRAALDAIGHTRASAVAHGKHGS